MIRTNSAGKEENIFEGHQIQSRMQEAFLPAAISDRNQTGKAFIHEKGKKEFYSY